MSVVEDAVVRQHANEDVEEGRVDVRVEPNFEIELYMQNNFVTFILYAVPQRRRPRRRRRRAQRGAPRVARPDEQLST